MSTKTGQTLGLRRSWLAPLQLTLANRASTQKLTVRKVVFVKKQSHTHSDWWAHLLAVASARHHESVSWIKVSRYYGGQLSDFLEADVRKPLVDRISFGSSRIVFSRTRLKRHVKSRGPRTGDRRRFKTTQKKTKNTRNNQEKFRKSLQSIILL